VRAVVGGGERAAEREDRKRCDELLAPIEREIDRILTAAACGGFRGGCLGLQANTITGNAPRRLIWRLRANYWRGIASPAQALQLLRDCHLGFAPGRHVVTRPARGDQNRNSGMASGHETKRQGEKE
jgi:hypothetical protein